MARKKRTVKEINDVARKRLRRREGHVKRYEIVLVAESARDQYIAEWMGDHLKRGQASEFMRQAIEEKIARALLGQDIDTPQAIVASEQVMMLYEEIRDERQRASDQFEAFIQEIHALRAELSSFKFEATRITETVRVYQDPAPVVAERPPSLPEQGGVVASSGLDMSRPRPRKQLPRSAPAPEPVPDELTEQQQIELAQIMAQSIRNARPGRG